MTLKHTDRAVVTHATQSRGDHNDRKALSHISLLSSADWHRLRFCHLAAGPIKRAEALETSEGW